MAVVDMRTMDADEHFWGYGVDFGSELVAAPTTYVWAAFGASTTIAYLYGTGITSSGGVPTSRACTPSTSTNSSASRRAIREAFAPSWNAISSAASTSRGGTYTS